MQCDGGSGEGSDLCFYAGTAVLPGQDVAGVVAEAAAVAEGKEAGAKVLCGGERKTGKRFCQ